MGRDELIRQKEEVKAEIAQLRTQLADVHAATPRRGSAGRAAEIENRLEALMAEEQRLRLLIDRSR